MKKVRKPGVKYKKESEKDLRKWRYMQILRHRKLTADVANKC